MCGSSSSAIPGACARRGPANENGDARSENIGSVSTLSPLACTKEVAWPIQVTLLTMEALASAFSRINSRSGAEGRGRYLGWRRQMSPTPIPLPAHHFGKRPSNRIDVVVAKALRRVMGLAIGHRRHSLARLTVNHAMRGPDWGANGGNSERCSNLRARATQTPESPSCKSRSSAPGLKSDAIDFRVLYISETPCGMRALVANSASRFIGIASLAQAESLRAEGGSDGVR